MKLIIKNDNRDIIKNPNIKVIETTKTLFINETIFLENNDVPIVKFIDTGAVYFIKDLDNLYEKSKSEVLLNITIDNLESINSGNDANFIPLESTLEDNPVTGNIIMEHSEGSISIYMNELTNPTYNAINSTSSGLQLVGEDDNGGSQIDIFATTGIKIFAPDNTKGLYSTIYFGENYDDNTYVQKKICR